MLRRENIKNLLKLIRIVSKRMPRARLKLIKMTIQIVVVRRMKIAEMM
jgi:hypothetical protein